MEEMLYRLSDRERQVLELTAKGKTQTAIADVVGLAPRTVRDYMQRVYSKLGAPCGKDGRDYVIQLYWQVKES